MKPSPVVWAVLLTALVLNAASGQSPQRVPFSIRTDPSVLPANGVATATVTVTVPPGYGVADGTVVNFSTTAGTVTQTTTRLFSGQARIQLRAGTQPAFARVTAIIGGVNYQTVEVEFTNEPVQVRFAPKLLIARGDHLTFNPKRLLIVAKGRSEFRFGNLTIKTARAVAKVEYNLANETLIADGVPGEQAVTIASETNTVRGDHLKYLLYQHEGAMDGVVPRNPGPPTRMFLKGVSLSETVDDPGTLNFRNFEYDFFAGAWIMAKRMFIRRNDRVLMEQATFYINGKKQVTLPYHTAPLPGFQNIGGRYGTTDAIGLNSAGGVTLDLPLYYRAQPTGSGAVHFRHVGGGGFYNEQPGFSMAMQDDYFAGDRGQGTFMLDRIGRRDWGSTITHNQQFARGFQGNFVVDSPFHRDAFAQQTFYRDLPGVQLTTQSFQSLVGGADNFGLNTFAQTTPRVIGRTGMTYFFAGSFFGDYFADGDTKFNRRETVSTVLFPRALRLTPSTSMQTSFRGEAGHATGLSGGVGNGATVSLDQRFSSQLSTTLSLNHDHSYGSPRQRSLSFSLNGFSGDRVGVYAFGSRNLTDRTTFAGLFTHYNLGRRWRFSTESAHFEVVGDRELDHEISAGYLLGQHEVKLTYSKSRHRIFFQVGTARF